jgi:subtilisin family serine protease
MIRSAGVRIGIGAAVLCLLLASAPVGALAAQTPLPGSSPIPDVTSGAVAQESATPRSADGRAARGDYLGAVAPGLEVSALVRTESGFRSSSARGRAGVRTVSSVTGGFEATGDVAALRGLLDVPGVQSIEILDPVVPDTVSEGLGVMDVALLRGQGLTGSGVKIAVVDVGFNGYRSLLGTDLPAAVTVASFRQDGATETGIAHGTGVAEIVYDIAPDAQFYLVTIADELDFALAVDYLIAEGVDVANMSAGWLMGPFDGTSFQAAQVDRAAAAGITWVNSAGNYADSHWGGDFSDPDGDGWMAFSGSADLNSFWVAPGGWFQVAITWASDVADYDLYLFDANGEVAESAAEQPGSAPPEEYITWQNTSASWANYWIQVDRFSGGSYRVDAFFNGVYDLTEVSPDRSITTPGDAAGAVTAGAVAWNNSSVIEPFSSQGPTVDGRPKPDLVGPDRVTTRTYGAGGFAGTSASSPHVAGLAALYLQRDPGLSPTQVKAALTADAADLGTPGWDPVFGFGLARTADVVLPGPVPTVVLGGGVTIGEGSTFTRSGSFTDTDPSSWTATVDWGEGAGVQPLSLSGMSFSLAHVYLREGVYPMTVCVADESSQGCHSATVTVANVAPSVAATSDISLTAGTPWAGSGSFTDPGNDTWAATVDWGDGTGLQSLPLNGKGFALAHVWSMAGTYTVTVAVTDDAGSRGSATLRATVAATLPSVPTALSGQPGNRQAIVAWQAPGFIGGATISDFAIQYRRKGVTAWSTFQDGVSATLHSHVTGLAGGTVYQFRVAARNRAGQGPWSPVVEARVGVPTAPTTSTAAPGRRQATISWQAPASNNGASVTDYVIQYRRSGTSAWVTFADGRSTTKHAHVTRLANGTLYEFRVAAKNSRGTGPWSTVVQATPRV